MLTMGPMVAGVFYPADPGTLKAEVHRLLGEVRAGRSGAVRGLIVPHAGYRFSGPVAASAYALVEAGRYERIVLVGPSHFARFPGVAQPVVDTWTIPLGEFPIDALDVPGLEKRREPFRNEHSLEVQLPFLHETLGPLPITPIVTGEVTPEQFALVLDAAVDEDTLLVVSTDLSHYLPYEAANLRDMETATAVISGNPEVLGRDSACGLIGLQAALLLAQQRGWAAYLLDLRNSGDTDGDPTRVVGYGAFALEERYWSEPPQPEAGSLEGEGQQGEPAADWAQRRGESSPSAHWWRPTAPTAPLVGRYEVVPHTADTGIVTLADTLEAVIAGAAFAMFDLMYDVDGSGPTSEVEVVIAAAEAPDLLVAVLSELLYRGEVDGLAFSDFEVRVADDRALVRARGYPVESLEIQGPPIKAVTYHDLRCEPTDDGWVAQVIFDV